MKSKNNIKVFKKMVKEIAKDYGIKSKWRGKNNFMPINVFFSFKKSGHDKAQLVILMDYDKIVSGKYSKSMAEYNIRRKINTWINKIYDEQYKKMSEID